MFPLKFEAATFIIVFCSVVNGPLNLCLCRSTTFHEGTGATKMVEALYREHE